MARRSLLLCCAAVAAALPAFGGPVHAQSLPNADFRFNPNPAADDVVLPMPGGLRMVFRVLEVPGDGYWGGAERAIQVGGSDKAGIFENIQRRQLGGSFRRGDQGPWVIYLGKYEVTKAQFIVVMGDGDEGAGRKALLDASIDGDDPLRNPASSNEHNFELARPVTGVSVQTLQSFIDRYSLWCLNTSECRNKLPELHGEPGFFRLPTELEWEYAARGGLSALKAQPNGVVPFDQPLPIREADVPKHAAVKQNSRGRPRVIGNLLPINGFYDLFGNAAELTAGPFHAELAEGKTGALALRGGSFMSDGASIRSYLREEAPLFVPAARGERWEPRRATNVGIRLAIGSVALPQSEKARKALETEHKLYLDTQRAATPAGATLHNPAIQAGVPLSAIDPLLAALRARGVGADELAQIAAHLTASRVRLGEAARQGAEGRLNLAMANSAIIADYVWRLQQVTGSLPMLRQHAAKSSTSQAVLADAEAKAKQYDSVISMRMEIYSKEIKKMVDEFPATFKNYVDAFGSQNFNKVDKAAFNLLVKHLDDAKARRAAPDAWLADMRRTFEDSTLWTQ